MKDNYSDFFVPDGNIFSLDGLLKNFDDDCDVQNKSNDDELDSDDSIFGDIDPEIKESVSASLLICQVENFFHANNYFFYKVLDNKGCRYVITEFQLERLPARIHICCEGLTKTICIHSTLPLICKKDNIEKLSHFLNYLNLCLPHGAFLINEKSREVVYKYDCCCSCKGFNVENFDYVLKSTLSLIDLNYEKILEIAIKQNFTGVISPE